MKGKSAVGNVKDGEMLENNLEPIWVLEDGRRKRGEVKMKTNTNLKRI